MAGFSTAPLEDLYSPPISDAIAGYQAVNVESQILNPSSLLNWMKKLIALRKQYKVFGRGSLVVLSAISNKKILVYVRKYEKETVLVVASLSSCAESVYLDLSEFAGLTPVEMFGGNRFPTVGEKPYQLTLVPYGFFWFLLEGA